jgi:hypothetical protein
MFRQFFNCEDIVEKLWRFFLAGLGGVMLAVSINSTGRCCVLGLYGLSFFLTEAVETGNDGKNL